MEDYLGNEIRIGMRALIVHSMDYRKEFKKVTIMNLYPKTNEKLSGERVSILTDGNERTGWTYPKRLIVETAFKDKI